MQNHILQQEIPPALVGIDGTAINAAVTGLWVPVFGWYSAVVEVEFTYGAGTGISFYLDTTNVEGPNIDAPGASKLGQYQNASTSAGTTTFTRKQFVRSSLTASGMFRFDGITLNDNFIRIATLIAAGSPTTADTAVVRIRLSNR